MAHGHAVIQKAIAMRKQGMSVPVIATTLQVAKSSVFRWVGEVKISKVVVRQLAQNSIIGRKKGLARIAAVRHLVEEQRICDADRTVADISASLDRAWWRLIAALIFWCEGSKRPLSQGVHVANSDPDLIRVFLHAFRSGFDLDESRLRVFMHLHEYHDPVKISRFWSRVTNIPLRQFNRPYLKPHTGKRLREGYQGCISVRYSDANLSRTLSALYCAFAKVTGAW